MPEDKSGLAAVGQAVKDTGLGLINVVGAVTGKWDSIYQSTTLDKLSPEDNARRITAYRTSLGFDAANLPGEGVFDQYVGAHSHSADDFAKVAVAGGTFAEKLKAAGANAIPLQTSIANALALTPETIKAQNEYKTRMGWVDKAIKDTNSEFYAGNMVSFLHKSVSNAKKAISTQHAAEKTALEALFKTPTFDNDLNTALGGALSTAELSNVKKDMLASLQESQKNDLTEFNKGTDKPLTQMHTAAKLERNRVNELARLSEQSENMKKEIERAYQQNRQKGTANLTIGQQKNGRAASLKGVKITDLRFIESITGLIITPSKTGTDKNGKDTYSFSMQLPHRYLRADYYLSSHNKIKADMLSMVGAVKAAGYSAVTLRLDHPDSEHAMKLARAAYEAAIELGFDTKDITLIVNGEKTSADKAFGNSSGDLKAAHEKAAANTRAEKAADDVLNNDVDEDRFKKFLQEGRLGEATAQAEAQDKAMRKSGDGQPISNKTF